MKYSIETLLCAVVVALTACAGTSSLDGEGAGDLLQSEVSDAAIVDSGPGIPTTDVTMDVATDATLEEVSPDAPSDAPSDATSAPDGAKVELQRLDAMAEEFRALHGLPGVGVIAFNDADVLAMGVAGVRKFGGTAAITDADKFHLGSCTKAMTATLVAKLVEQGGMDFDATLSDLFPGVKVHVDLQSVTIRQLLRHEGGVYSDIINQAPDLWSSLWEAGADDIMTTRSVFAEAVLTAEPPHAPGGYHYSNTGYILVGAIIEDHMGAPWEDVITTHLFEPFQMEGCGFGAAGDPDAEDQPWGHRQKNGQSQSIPPGPQGDNPPALGPAGTVHCPLASWANFMMGHLGGGPAGYLTAGTWAELHTSGPSSQYALGWLVTGAGGLQHFGSNTMNVAGAWLFPQEGMGYAIVTNTGPSSLVTGPMGDWVPDIAEAVAPGKD